MYPATPNRSVVITAFGFCSPAGLTDDALDGALAAGPAAGTTLHVEDEALDGALSTQIPWSEQRRMDRLTRLGVQASMTCFHRSGLAVDAANCERVGGIFASVFGPIASTRDFMLSGMQKGIRGASPLLFPYTVVNACSGIVTILLGLRGFSSTVSGSNPLCYAFDTLRAGRAEALLAGGFDELTPEIVGALSEPMVAGEDRTGDPIRPLSEGAAVVMMETRDHAALRGAAVLCEVRGWGQALNLSTAPSGVDHMGPIDPAAIETSMRQALSSSTLRADEVDEVVSLARIDNGQVEAEAEALRAVFGEHAPNVRYPKHAIGETFAASDTFGVIAALLYGAGATGRIVIVNSYQLGGNVSSVVLRV